MVPIGVMADNDETLPLSPGDRFGDYIVERMLGRGSMGTVYLMRTPDGSAYAVKIMHRDKMTHDMRVRFVIMDYVPGGTLADRIAKSGRATGDAAAARIRSAGAVVWRKRPGIIRHRQAVFIRHPIEGKRRQ